MVTPRSPAPRRPPPGRRATPTRAARASAAGRRTRSGLPEPGGFGQLSAGDRPAMSNQDSREQRAGDEPAGTADADDERGTYYAAQAEVDEAVEDVARKQGPGVPS